MIKAVYNKGRPYDELLQKIIEVARKSIIDKDDDVLFLNVGLTGSGKTNLSFHEYELFTSTPDSNQIALTTKRFSDALVRGKNLPVGERVLVYDEVKMNKRRGMSNWNNDMMELYFKIRGLRFLHIWNHPDPNMIDQEFIRERVSGMFFVYEKVVDRPRRYYFFRKQDLLNALIKYKKLSLHLLKEHGDEFAYYRGCFQQYKGELLKSYLTQKKEGMDDAVEEFHKKHGTKSDGLTISEFARRNDVHISTVKRALTTLTQDGLVDDQVLRTVAGQYRLTKNVEQLILDKISKKLAVPKTFKQNK